MEKYVRNAQWHMRKNGIISQRRGEERSTLLRVVYNYSRYISRHNAVPISQLLLYPVYNTINIDPNREPQEQQQQLSNDVTVIIRHLHTRSKDDDPAHSLISAASAAVAETKSKLYTAINIQTSLAGTRRFDIICAVCGTQHQHMIYSVGNRFSAYILRTY